MGYPPNPPQSRTLSRRRGSLLTSPYSTLVVASASIYTSVWKIPSDVTRVRFRIADRDMLGIGGNAADHTSQKVACGQPNEALTDWASSPQLQTGLTYPAIGQWCTTDWFDAKPNAAGYIMVAWTVPAATVNAELSNYYGGVYKVGTDPTDLSGAATAANGPLAVLMEYDTDAIPLLWIGDSLPRGISATSTDSGLLNAYHRMWDSDGYAVQCNSVGGTSAASWAARTNWMLPEIWFPYCQDANVFISLAFNDIAVGASASTIIGNLQSIYRDAKALGAKRVVYCTCSPSSTLTGPQNTQRGLLNPWVRGSQDYLDIDALVRDPNSVNQLLHPATGNIHWQTASYTDIINAFPALS